MNASWSVLLRHLATLGRQVNVEWHMANGAVFYMAVPHVDQHQCRSFTDDVDFPFWFEEIERLEIRRQFGEVILNVHMDEIARSLPLCPNLKYSFTGDSIVVDPAKPPPATKMNL